MRWVTVQGLSIFDGSLRVDEKLALSLLAVAVAALIHSFSYTAAEGAHPSERWTFRRAADALAFLSAYCLLRIWF